MAISKVTYAGNTLIDLTGDTVTPENLLSGATAHAANGEEITGIVEDKKGELEAQIEDLRNQIGSLNANIAANTSAIATKSDSTVTDQLAQNTAQIETAGTATNAHSAGEYVMISNALYKVTAAVAKGDAWTIGTNVTAANIGSEISSLKSDLANHSALHVLPLSDIADAQNGFSIADCNVSIQGKIVLCWLSFGIDNITIPTWTNFAFAKLKPGYYPGSYDAIGIIQEQMSGLTGAIRVIENAIYINPHGVSFNSPNWCWGFVAYVLA